MTSARDPFALHNAVLDELRGRGNPAGLAALLGAGADPHAPDSNGETPFNIAAANAPLSGRLMTLHWFDQALAGMGTKGLNACSGAHGSTLAQYMAKWLYDDELAGLFARGVAAGMRVDIPNKSGWTPLMAGAAMGRVAAVRALLPHYSHASLCAQASGEYRADYGGEGRIVTYNAGLNAAELAQERLFQDEGLDEAMGEALWLCVETVVAAIAEKGRGA